MLAKVLIECLRGHWRKWGERALVVMVSVLSNLNIRREGFWFLVDVRLLSANLGAELDVVDVAWLVQECEEAFALDGVVFGADACKKLKIGMDQLLPHTVNDDDLSQLRNPRGSIDAKL